MKTFVYNPTMKSFVHRHDKTLKVRTIRFTFFVGMAVPKRKQQPWTYESTDAIFKRIKHDNVVNGVWTLVQKLPIKSQQTISDQMSNIVAMEVDKLDQKELKTFQDRTCLSLNESVKCKTWQVGVDTNIAWVSFDTFGCSFGTKLKSHYHRQTVQLDDLCFTNQSDFDTFWKQYPNHSSWSSYHAMMNCLCDDYLNGDSDDGCTMFETAKQLEPYVCSCTCYASKNES